MSLQAILDAIQEASAAEVRAIERQAQAQAEELLQATRPRAEKIRQTHMDRSTRAARRERARIMHHARLESLCATGDARQELIDETLQRAAERLAAMRSHPDYPQLLRRLLQEALQTLETSVDEVAQCRLRADPRDRQLLDPLLDELGLSLQVDYDLDCWGGVIASSAGERILVINTLDSRFDRAHLFLRRSLAARLHRELEEDEPRLATITETPD
ncbi:MAG: V-type ATP synthase subunit E [Chloroflexota bacterium]